MFDRDRFDSAGLKIAAIVGRIRIGDVGLSPICMGRIPESGEGSKVYGAVTCFWEVGRCVQLPLSGTTMVKHAANQVANISQFDIPAPRALRLPNKAVNWFRLGVSQIGCRTRALECRTSLLRTPVNTGMINRSK